MSAANINGNNIVFDPSKRIRAAIGDDVVEKIENDSFSRFEKISVGCAIPNTDNGISTGEKDVGKDKGENDMAKGNGGFNKFGKMFHTVNKEDLKQQRRDEPVQMTEQEIIDERVRRSGSTYETIFHGPLYNFLPSVSEMGRISSFESRMMNNTVDHETGKKSKLVIGTDIFNIVASTVSNLAVKNMVEKSVIDIGKKEYKSGMVGFGVSVLVGGATKYLTGANRAKYFGCIDKNYFTNGEFDKFEKILNKKLVKNTIIDTALEVIVPFAVGTTATVSNIKLFKDDENKKALIEVTRGASTFGRALTSIKHIFSEPSRYEAVRVGSGPKGELNHLEYNDIPFKLADILADRIITRTRDYNTIATNLASVAISTSKMNIKPKYVDEYDEEIVLMPEELKTIPVVTPTPKSVVDSVIIKSSETSTAKPAIKPVAKPKATKNTTSSNV